MLFRSEIVKEKGEEGPGMKVAIPMDKEIYNSLKNNKENPVNIYIPEFEGNSTAAPQKATTKQSNAYTRAELKAMSPNYTDAVIDAAVKAGKIKLKD